MAETIEIAKWRNNGLLYCEGLQFLAIEDCGGLLPLTEKDTYGTRERMEKVR